MEKLIDFTGAKRNMAQLDVPLILQENDFSCTPVCIKMVLEYIRKKFVDIPELDIPTISKALKTDEAGTMFMNLKGINEALLKSFPSVDFIHGWGHKLEEIEEEIKQAQRPVIAWVYMPSPQGEFPHSIVITDVDRENLLIYYNDPVYGKKQIPLGQFISMWEKSFSILIKVKIGERRQRFIEEYAQEK